MTQVDPHFEDTPAWISAGIRQQVLFRDLPSVFGPTFEKVSQLAINAGAKLVGPAYAHYFGAPTEVVDVEIGFGIDSAIRSDELTITELPAGRAVVGVHLGPYEKLAESYEQMIPWLAKRPELVLAEHMFEFYESMPGQDEAEAVTRLVFPLI